MEKVFLKISQYSQENTCVGVCLNKVGDLKARNSIKKRPTQVFSWNIANIFKNIIFYRTPPMTASKK